MNTTTQWNKLLEDNGENLPLDKAMCLMAHEEDSNIVPENLLGRLDKLTEKLYLPSLSDPFDCIARINLHLFQTHGFKGAVADYYHPHNSQLHYVLQERKGIPISLSAIYMEIARKVGFPMNGIGFPGHFIVQTASPTDPPFFIDSFQGGKILCIDDLQCMLQQYSSQKISLQEAIRPISNQKMLLRMSGNLFYAYQKQQNVEGMLRNIDRMLLLQENAFNLHRIRSQLLAKLGKYQEAAHALEVYLEKNPCPQDLEECIQELSLLKGIG